jgi:hypothetical protein
MKKHFFYILAMGILFLFGKELTAQKTFMKVGKVPMEDLQMTTYAADTSAEAVILGDFGYTRFAYSQNDWFTIDFYRHVRIKILDKDGFDWADFEIPLYLHKSGKDEDLSGIKAVTVNLEKGKPVVEKLSRGNLIREMKNKNVELVKFTMPNIKEGSVIDISYKVRSPFLWNLNPWFFQDEIPVKRSEYHVFIPEYFYYKNWINGYIYVKKESEVLHETYQYTQSASVDGGLGGGRESGGIRSFEAEVKHWTYLAENVPAFRDEPYITTSHDYLSFLEFELVSTDFPGSIKEYYTRSWEDIREDLMDDPDFGKQIDNSGHLKDQISLINLATNDPLEKMKMAYEHIKNRMVWDKRYRTQSYDGVRKSYNEAGGTSADINLNLVALCRGLGLKANPVIVSTRSHRKLRPGQVILSQFNHVVVCIEIGKDKYVLDAIDPYCPYYMLPPNTLNGQGMMISENGFEWVDLLSDLPADEVFYAELSINDDLEFEGRINNVSENFAALKERKKIKKYASENEHIEKMEQNLEGLEITNFEVENLDSIYNPLKVNAEVIMTDKIIEGGDRLYFVPILFDRLEENPYKNDERKFPIDYNYPLNEKYTTLINLPAGYEVEEIPESMLLSLPDNGGKFLYNIKMMDNQLAIHYEFVISQTLFPATQYGEIKKFYELIVAKQAEQVVLKRIN